MSRISVLVLSFSLASGLTAQQAVTPTPIGDTPIEYFGEYHFASGTWSHGGARAGSRVIYNCSFAGGYFNTVGNSWATNADHLWIDEGKLADFNHLSVEQIDGFDFSYCSSDLDPMNNGSIRIAFYDDYVPCTSPPAALCDYVLTGLPLSTSGNPECHAISIDLSGGFECSTDLANPLHTTEVGGADRSFGWAFGANPGQTGMNDTGPVLAKPCPTPLSNCVGGNGFVNAGNENYFYWEDPAHAWTGCYWFGGVPWAGFSMKLFAPPAGAFPYGHANNSLDLSSTEWAPGGAMTWSVSGHSPSNQLFLIASRFRNPRPHPGGEFLLAKPYMVIVPMNAAAGTIVRSVPATMVGPVYAQAMEATMYSGGSAVALSNGLVHL